MTEEAMRAEYNVFLAIQKAEQEDFDRTIKTIKDYESKLSYADTLYGIQLWRLPREWEKHASRDQNAGLAGGYFFGYEIRSTFGAKLAVEYLRRWSMCFSRNNTEDAAHYEARLGRKVIAAA